MLLFALTRIVMSGFVVGGGDGCGCAVSLKLLVGLMIGMLLFVNGLFVSMVAFRSTFELSNMLVANGSTITVEFFLVQWVCPSDDAIIFIII